MYNLLISIMTEQYQEKEKITSEDNNKELKENTKKQVVDNNTINNEQSYIEKQSEEIESKNKNESITTADNIDYSKINYKDFEKIDQEQIDTYYMLNDNKNNIEFLNEDLVIMSKKEEEIKALKAKEKEEFDFQMEELVSDGDEIKVDLTGIVDEPETIKE